MQIPVYAHNGARFDTLLIYREFRATHWGTDNVFVIGKSPTSINYFIITGKRFKVSFCDTVKFYAMSLNKWSSIVKGLKEQVMIDMKHFFETSRTFNCRWFCLNEDDRKKY